MLLKARMAQECICKLILLEVSVTYIIRVSLLSLFSITSKFLLPASDCATPDGGLSVHEVAKLVRAACRAQGPSLYSQGNEGHDTGRS